MHAERAEKLFLYPSDWPIQVLWQTGSHILWCYWGENRNSWTWRQWTPERFLWWNCTLSESELLYTFILLTINWYLKLHRMWYTESIAGHVSAPPPSLLLHSAMWKCHQTPHITGLTLLAALQSLLLGSGSTALEETLRKVRCSNGVYSAIACFI